MLVVSFLQCSIGGGHEAVVDCSYLDLMLAKCGNCLLPDGVWNLSHDLTA
jgi:hypothetical protein